MCSADSTAEMTVVLMVEMLVDRTDSSTVVQTVD